jgi:hypothetical protein
MKKLIVLSLIMAGMILMADGFTPAYPQASTTEDTPTFYRLVPGTYVNGYPRFTIHYPKDWVERPAFQERGGVFRASLPGASYSPGFSILINTYPGPLNKLSDVVMRTYRAISVDATLVSDKTIQLPDGSEAQEVETTAVMYGGPRTEVAVGIKKGEWWTMISMAAPATRIGDDLRAIPYTIKYEPEKDKPVKVPSDVQAFFDTWKAAILAHDLAKVMTHYSDRYLNSGTKKGGMEPFWRQMIGLFTASEVGITEFIPAGDGAYVAGFGSTNLGKGMLSDTSIIKENGEWKWYGNQRDVAP